MSSTLCGALKFWVAEGYCRSDGDGCRGRAPPAPRLLPGQTAFLYHSPSKPANPPPRLLFLPGLLPLFTEGNRSPPPQHPPLLWATTSQMASESEMLR